MSMTTISSYLVTKVQGVSGVDPSLVFPYEMSQLPGWPTIAITLKDWSGRFLTNTQNERIYTFTIRIYQEINKENEGPQTAEANMVSLADNIVASFDTDTRLGNTGIYAVPIGGKMGWLQDQPVRILDTEIEVHDVTPAA